MASAPFWTETRIPVTSLLPQQAEGVLIVCLATQGHPINIPDPKGPHTTFKIIIMTITERIKYLSGLLYRCNPAAHYERYIFLNKKLHIFLEHMMVCQNLFKPVQKSFSVACKNSSHTWVFASATTQAAFQLAFW